MSGPIVRKYGFPNHESIFGKREIEHGVEPSEDELVSTTATHEPAAGAAKGEKKGSKKKSAPKKKG